MALGTEWEALYCRGRENLVPRKGTQSHTVSLSEPTARLPSACAIYCAKLAALKSKAKRIKQTILFLICRPDYNPSPAPPPWPARLDGVCAVHQNPNPRQGRQRLAGPGHTVFWKRTNFFWLEF